MKFISRFLKKKAPPPTSVELGERLELVKSLLERYSETGRSALAFAAEKDVKIEFADMPEKKLGAFYKNENKIILNYNKPISQMVNIMAHEITHAAQIDTTMSYDLENPYTPFKTMMLQRYSEAQAFVIGAATAREVYDNMKAEMPETAAKYIKGFKPDPVESAYANAITAEPQKPMQAMRAAFDAFIQDPKSESHNYDQNIGYDCEYNTTNYTKTPKLDAPNIEKMHLNDLTPFGRVPFGTLKDRNFLTETGAHSLTTKAYTSVRDNWVQRNMNEVEMFQKWQIAKTRNVESDTIEMRIIASDIRHDQVPQKTAAVRKQTVRPTSF